MRLFFLFSFVLSTFSGFSQGNMNVSLQYQWSDTLLPASNAHFNTYNEIWGHAKAGREYAIIGTTMGTHIHDITDQGSEEEVAFIPGELQGTQVVHRDYDTYQDHLYIVCDEGNSTLQIVDISQLPDTAIVVYDNDSLLVRSHNIFIDTVSARMYVCGGTEIFAVYSLANPAHPTRLLNAPNDLAFWSGIGYIHDVFVRNDIAYVNAGNNGIFVVDFSDLNDVLMLGSLTFYEQSGYNHSGWLMENGNYYCLADETHGMDLKILDVSDLQNIHVVDTIGVDIAPLSIPHNLIYKGDYLHVAYYHDGYYVWDCSNPESPFIAGYYDTSTQPHLNNYRGAWGVYPFLPSGRVLVSDMQEGLFVFDVSNVTGVDEIQNDRQADLNVFPTIANQIVYVNIPALEENASLSVVNAIGQVIYSELINSKNSTTTETLDVSAFESGLYHVVVQSSSESHTGRIIIR
ncbi:MAG: choice-of-anchor B domain-containing protein [Granulosicoccus sp.]|jgi:choice-of-anchor B domain-containing protein